MSNILIIGYGNTLRGDDAAGIRAAETIARRFPTVECICVHQLEPEQAEQIAESDLVIFLDAQVDIQQPQVRTIVPNNKMNQPRTHFISPDSLLALSQQLYKRVPAQAYVIGIPASVFEFSEELSNTTKHSMNECIELVSKMISDFLKKS